ncbi:cytochrome c biogenesis CcdA family protein [Microbacterium pseudoresistens]|nr:cytochrome c biogenesis protein CcdA [Microbacterium pseudoresistens]
MLAGLISFLSPCVLPLVPGYLGYLGGAVSGVAGRGSADPAAPPRRRLVLGVLLFIAGFTLVFVLLTIIGGAAGMFFARWGDLITRILGAVIILMGLVFIGLFGFAQRTIRINLTGRAGLIGAPLLGIALGLGWTPCMGPTLTAITAVAWNLGDPWRAGLLGVAYSLGLGIPFLLVALGFGWATRSIGFLRRHVRTVNIIGGALLIVLGVLMVTGVWTDVMSRLGAVMLSVDLPL